MKAKLFFILLVCIAALVSCEDKKPEIDQAQYYYGAEFVNFSDIIADYDGAKIYDSNILSSGGFALDGGFITYTTFDNDEDPDEIAGRLNYDKDSLISDRINTPSCILEFDSEKEKLKFTPLRLRFDSLDLTMNANFNVGWCGRLSDGSYIADINMPIFYFLASGDQNGLSSMKTGNQHFLGHFDSDGLLIGYKQLYDIDYNIGKSGVNQKYIIDSSDIVYIYLDEANNSAEEAMVAAVTPDGELLYSVNFRETLPDYANRKITEPTLIHDSDGNVCVIFRRLENGKRTYEYYRLRDPAEGDALYDRTVIANSLDAGKVYLAPGYDAYLSDNYGLYAENQDSSGYLRLLYWSDLGVASTFIQWVRIFSPEKIWACFLDPYTSEPYFVLLTGSDKPIDDGRKTITLAFEESNANDGSQALLARRQLLLCASKFNYENKEYKIKLKAYTGDDGLSANDKLLRDIISGSSPDMVLFGGTISPEPFISANAFRDFYEFMDADEKYTRDAFLPCVLAPFETSDGRLPFLTMNFTFNTIAGKAELLDNSGSWTVDEFADLIGSIGGDEYLMRVDGVGNPQQELFGLLLPAVIDEYIDYENQTCDFSGNFARLMELCKNVPLLTGDGYLHPKNYADGRVLLDYFEIDSASDYLIRKYAVFADAEISAVGFPRSEDRASGTVIVPDMSFGITKQSGNADGAWEFTKFYLDRQTEAWDSYLDRVALTYNSNGFAPTYETADSMFRILEQMAVYFMAKPVELDSGEDGIKTQTVIYNRPSEGIIGNTNVERVAVQLEEMYAKQGAVALYFTAADEAFLRELFDSCTVAASSDDAVINIILEEASAYFAGGKSLDKVVKLIQNRVETRISE